MKQSAPQLVKTEAELAQSSAGAGAAEQLEQLELALELALGEVERLSDSVSELQEDQQMLMGMFDSTNSLVVSQASTISSLSNKLDETAGITSLMQTGAPQQQQPQSQQPQQAAAASSEELEIALGEVERLSSELGSMAKRLDDLSARAEATTIVADGLAENALAASAERFAESDAKLEELAQMVDIALSSKEMLDIALEELERISGLVEGGAMPAEYLLAGKQAAGGAEAKPDSRIVAALGASRKAAESRELAARKHREGVTAALGRVSKGMQKQKEKIGAASAKAESALLAVSLGAAKADAHEERLAGLQQEQLAAEVNFSTTLSFHAAALLEHERAAAVAMQRVKAELSEKMAETEEEVSDLTEAVVATETTLFRRLKSGLESVGAKVEQGLLMTVAQQPESDVASQPQQAEAEGADELREQVERIAEAQAQHDARSESGDAAQGELSERVRAVEASLEAEAAARRNAATLSVADVLQLQAEQGAEARSGLAELRAEVGALGEAHETTVAHNALVESMPSWSEEVVELQEGLAVLAHKIADDARVSRGGAAGVSAADLLQMQSEVGAKGRAAIAEVRTELAATQQALATTPRNAHDALSAELQQLCAFVFEADAGAALDHMTAQAKALVADERAAAAEGRLVALERSALGSVELKEIELSRELEKEKVAESEFGQHIAQRTLALERQLVVVNAELVRISAVETLIEFVGQPASPQPPQQQPAAPVQAVRLVSKQFMRELREQREADDREMELEAALRIQRRFRARKAAWAAVMTRLQRRHGNE